MKRLFGTDGIRAVAGKAPLDGPTVRRFGKAMAEVLGHEDGSPCRVVLARDTRESGPWLRDAVASGLAYGGGTAVDAGVIPTPGLAHIVRTGDFDAGVMISASHNPFEDNGLKAFGPDGAKIPDAMEKQVEQWILDHDIPDPGDRENCVKDGSDLTRDYIRHLEEVVHPVGCLKGLRIVIDCANGAAYESAPEVYRHHGAEVHVLGDTPNGRNINLDCGSLHTEGLAKEVRRLDYDLGLAFDGDADRCLAVDRKGRLVDGDHILYICGRQLRRNGALRGDSVVATIMSNFWLEDRLGQEGIRLHRARVGDKYVREMMLAEDSILGGEQSGHIIFREHATTGDGVLTGLLLLQHLATGPEPLDRIMDGIVPYPQVLLNVRVNEKPDLRTHPRIGPKVAEVESSLEGSGRVVLRYSGTEPVARVMLEGKDSDLIQRGAEEIAGLIGQVLGD